MVAEKKQRMDRQFYFLWFESFFGNASYTYLENCNLLIRINLFFRRMTEFLSYYGVTVWHTFYFCMKWFVWGFYGLCCSGATIALNSSHHNSQYHVQVLMVFVFYLMDENRYFELLNRICPIRCYGCCKFPPKIIIL